MTQLTVQSLRDDLKQNYLPNLKNYLGGENNALKFLSAVMYISQSNPKVLNCDKQSIMNAFMKCAELGLYPSSISGEAYIIPYGNKAQFQLGYQGIVTLLNRSGVSGIYSGIIRKNDKYSFINGNVQHEIDMTKSSEQRGDAIGAYATAKYNGQTISHFMHIDDIHKIREFSKTAIKDGKLSTDSAWHPSKDPEMWMYRKTTLKQLSKFLPKTEDVFKALHEDNQDSIIANKSHTVGGTEALAQLEGAQQSEKIPLNENQNGK